MAASNPVEDAKHLWLLQCLSRLIHHSFDPLSNFSDSNCGIFPSRTISFTVCTNTVSAHCDQRGRSSGVQHSFSPTTPTEPARLRSQAGRQAVITRRPVEPAHWSETNAHDVLIGWQCRNLMCRAKPIKNTHESHTEFCNRSDIMALNLTHFIVQGEACIIT